ncbi:MAG: hypothetical protein HDQ98_05015 [Lachnospiraceae bacterium]|nr:hypothetical protein [Lachnospiraceae bacterium]
MRAKIADVWKTDRLQAFFFGIAAVGCVYLSFCFSTISHIDQRFMLVHLLLAACAGSCYLLLCRKVCSQSSWCSQIRGWNTLYLICIVIFFVFNFGVNVRDRNWYEMLSQLIYLLIAACAEWQLLRHDGSQRKRRDFLRLLNEYKGLFALCVIALFLALDPDMIQFKWDGSTYYEANSRATLYSISSMALCGHISQTFSMIGLFFGAILGHNLGYGMAAGNVVLYLASIGAAYGIWKTILPGLDEKRYVLGTAVYAFSPYTLGMVDYYNTDFYSMCIFMLVVYYTVRRQWILQVISGLLFSFTKEPAFLIYGMFCVGVLLEEIFFRKAGSLPERIRRQFFRMRNYGMLMVAAIWGLTVMRLGVWGAGGDYGGFAVDTSYMVDKLKVLFMLNFGWSYVIIILCGVAAACCTKRAAGNRKEWIMPILCGGGVYTLFGCMFKTVNHPRYVSIIPTVLYLLAVYALITLLSNIWQGRLLDGVLLALALLMLVSSFWTIDPVSKLVFQTTQIGTGEMVTTGALLGDAAVYNRQMLWLERALGNAMKEGVEAGDQIVFPMIGNANYHFDGLVGVRGMNSVKSGEYVCYTQYWDGDRHRRELLPSERNKPFRLYEVTNEQALKELVSENGSDQRYRYFYLGFAGNEISDAVRAEYSVLEEKEFHYRGWIVYEMIFEGGTE